MNKQSIGMIGEDLATNYLESFGYKIVARNFKARYGEIDIIALHQNTLIFVEVKTRIGNRFGTPEEAITPRKLHEVMQTAQYFALKYPHLPQAQRMDVIGIVLDGQTYKQLSLVHTPSVTS